MTEIAKSPKNKAAAPDSEEVDVDLPRVQALHGARTMYLVKQLEMLLRSRMEPIARSVSLTVPQYTALSILYAHPGISSAELARRTFVSAQAANELVNALHGRGLILRRPSTDHAKILKLRLSKKGEQLLASCAAQMQRLEEMMLSALESEDAQTFHNGLRSCIKALDS